MPLTLYRRHLPGCAHKARNRRFNKCKCPIWVQGSLAGEYVRRSLDIASWQAASERVHEWEAAGGIGAIRPEIPSIAEAIEKYISDAEGRGLNPESVKKVRDVIVRRFKSFCDDRGYRQLRQLGVDQIRDFRNILVHDYAATSARIRLEYVRAFFRFCVQSNWLRTNPALVVKTPKPRERAVETFEQPEINRMLAVADSFNPRGIHGKGNRKRIRGMILLLRYSGLRISDAAMLGRQQLVDDKVSLRTIKTGSAVWCPLPKIAVDALQDSPSDNPQYFFWNSRCLRTSAVKIWETTFTRVFELAGIPEEKAFIHNFRHTFATDLLARGVPIEDVAILLGNSVRIVEKHYSHFVLARRERLEQRVRQLWAS